LCISAHIRVRRPGHFESPAGRQDGLAIIETGEFSSRSFHRNYCFLFSMPEVRYADEEKVTERT
jgi:hypothetical protein